MVKAKIKAASVHGIATLAVALVTAIFVYIIWYPGALADMAKGAGLYKLVLAVEVVLGPVMSLVIYNTSKPKKELVTDYLVIGVIQLAALGYGLMSVMQSRPAYLVFVKDRIEVVAAVELSVEDLSEAKPPFNRVGYFGAKLICTESPTDPGEKSDLLLSAVDGKDIQLFPKYYRKCEQGEVLGRSYQKNQFEQLTGLQLNMLPGSLQKESFNWLPVLTRFGAWTVFYPKGNIQTPVYLDINPFFDDKGE